MAANAPEHFAGHHGQEAVHPFDGGVVLIQRDKEQRPIRGQLEVGRTVRFHWDCAKNALQRFGLIIMKGLLASLPPLARVLSHSTHWLPREGTQRQHLRCNILDIIGVCLSSHIL